MSSAGQNADFDLAARLADTPATLAALQKAGREAIEEHARAGRKIVVWKDGQVVWEDARLPEDEGAPEPTDE